MAEEATTAEGPPGMPHGLIIVGKCLTLQVIFERIRPIDQIALIHEVGGSNVLMGGTSCPV